MAKTKNKAPEFLADKIEFTNDWLHDIYTSNDDSRLMEDGWGQWKDQIEQINFSSTINPEATSHWFDMYKIYSNTYKIVNTNNVSMENLTTLDSMFRYGFTREVEGPEGQIFLDLDLSTWATTRTDAKQSWRTNFGFLYSGEAHTNLSKIKWLTVPWSHEEGMSVYPGPQDNVCGAPWGAYAATIYYPWPEPTPPIIPQGESIIQEAENVNYVPLEIEYHDGIEGYTYVTATPVTTKVEGKTYWWRLESENGYTLTIPGDPNSGYYKVIDVRDPNPWEAESGSRVSSVEVPSAGIRQIVMAIDFPDPEDPSQKLKGINKLTAKAINIEELENDHGITYKIHTEKSPLVQDDHFVTDPHIDMYPQFVDSAKSEEPMLPQVVVHAIQHEELDINEEAMEVRVVDYAAI